MTHAYVADVMTGPASGSAVPAGKTRRSRCARLSSACVVVVVVVVRNAGVSVAPVGYLALV